MCPKNTLIQLACLALLCLSSCANPDIIIPGIEDLRERHVIKTDGYDCANYRTLNFLDVGESINKLLAVGDMLYFANFDRQLKAYSLTTNTTTLLADSIWLVNEMEVMGRTIYFCTWSGIYTLTDNDPSTFSRIWPHACNDIDVSSRGEVFLTGISFAPNSGLISQKAIYQLTENGQRLAYGPTEDALEGFERLNNGNVLAFNQSNTDKIYRFGATGTLRNTFTDENSPLGSGHFEDAVWTYASGNNFLVVLKNGLGLARILEWNDNLGTWHSYLEEESFGDLNDPENRWVFSDVVAPSYSDISVSEEELLIATSLAGCRGLQRFRLREGQLLSLEDIDIIRDEGLGVGHCLQGIQVEDDRRRKIIYSQRAVAILEGCE